MKKIIFRIILSEFERAMIFCAMFRAVNDNTWDKLRGEKELKECLRKVMKKMY